MLSDAPGYSEHHAMQVRDLQDFLSIVVKRMDWTQEEMDTVMDIGCGPGDSCLWTLLPTFPNVKKIIGIDILPDMIQYAKENNAHEKIEYHVGDIGDMSTIEKFSNTISKAVSIFCFHWLTDQKVAFLNIHRLLKPGGEAALIFILSANLLDSYPEIIQNDRWNKYLKDIDTHIPESHFKKHRALYYKSLLEDMGFTVEICQADDKTYVFPDDETCAEECYPICSLAKGIPPELKEEFKKEVLRAVVKFNGRSADGRPLFHYSTLSLHIKKPTNP